MYSCCSALVACFLLLISASFVPTVRSDTPTERCVYSKRNRVLLNESQSHDIICSSLHLHGSSYYHKMDTGMSTNENHWDMIHCEAVSRGYYNLHLYDEARSNGIKSLISSGACIISDGMNCTRVVLYVNLTYYDQRNGSVIPVCAFTTTDHNSECFCIHYLTLKDTMVEVTTDHPAMSTEPTSVKPADVTSTTPPDVHSQPNIGSPGALYSKAAFSGTVSVLSIVIVILLIAIAALIVAFVLYCKKKSLQRHHRVATYDPGSPTSTVRRPPQLETPPPVTSNKAKTHVGGSADHLRDLELGEETHDDDHDFGENQVLLRSLSSPT